MPGLPAGTSALAKVELYGWPYSHTVCWRSALARSREARITGLTLVTLAVVAYGVVNRGGYARALALGGATPVGAAAVAGGVAVPTFYAVAVGAAIGLALRLLEEARRPEEPTTAVPASRSLVLLVVVA